MIYLDIDILQRILRIPQQQNMMIWSRFYTSQEFPGTQTWTNPPYGENCNENLFSLPSASISRHFYKHFLLLVCFIISTQESYILSDSLTHSDMKHIVFFQTRVGNVSFQRSNSNHYITTHHLWRQKQDYCNIHHIYSGPSDVIIVRMTFNYYQVTEFTQTYHVVWQNIYAVETKSVDISVHNKLRIKFLLGLLTDVYGKWTDTVT